MTGSTLGAAAAILAFAYFVRGITGFGSALIAVPLLALRLPLPSVVPLMLFLDFVASLIVGGLGWKQVNWREIASLLPPAIAGSATGTWLLVSLPARPALLTLGAVVLLFGMRSLIGGEAQGRVSRGWAVPAALAGGTVSALFGTGGPPFVIYLSHRIGDRSELRATLSALFLVDGLVRIVAFAIAGLVTVPLMTGVAGALPILVLGLYAGHRVHLLLTDRTMAQVVGLVLIVAGGALLAKVLA